MKLSALILAFICVFAFVGCNSNTATDNPSAEPTPNSWGVTLEAENISPEGLTIVCKQSGGEEVSELFTGSFYTLQRSEDGEWKDIEFFPQEYDVTWTSEAWIIPKDESTEWKVDWEWLYGKLPEGEYRIGKEIMNFRKTGDYDEEIIYAYFEIR